MRLVRFFKSIAFIGHTRSHDPHLLDLYKSYLTNPPNEDLPFIKDL